MNSHTSRAGFVRERTEGSQTVNDDRKASLVEAACQLDELTLRSADVERADHEGDPDGVFARGVRAVHHPLLRKTNSLQPRPPPHVLRRSRVKPRDFKKSKICS